MFAYPLTERLAEFVRSVGIEVRATALPEEIFLPGLDIREGAILVDKVRFGFQGDILHEAGYVVFAHPAMCNAATLSPDGGDELTSIAWSYATLRHLGLDSAIVFHPAGCKGSSASIIENFVAGRYFGVPLRQLYGMSCQPPLAAVKVVPPHPHMLRWMR
jgi:hypothetical protein